MICPNCESDRTQHLETREVKCSCCDDLVEIDYHYCIDCTYVWKSEDGGFIAGAVSSEIVEMVQGVKDEVDEIEFVEVKQTNLVDCIFCGSQAIAEGNEYSCSSCGGSWKIV